MVPRHRWLVVVYLDIERSKPFCTFWCSTIRDAAYLVNETPATTSNTYHRLILPKNALAHTRIYKYLGSRRASESLKLNRV